METLTTTIKTQAIFPPDSKQALLSKVLIKLHNGPKSTPSIDFARVLKQNERSQQDISLANKHCLLDYATSNWLHHMKALPMANEGCESSGATSQLYELAFKKQLLVKHRPWDDCFPWPVQIIWAMSEDHLPLLKCLSKQHKDYLTSYMTKAVGAFATKCSPRAPDYPPPTQPGPAHFPRLLSIPLKSLSGASCSSLET